MKIKNLQQVRDFKRISWIIEDDRVNRIENQRLSRWILSFGF